MASLVTSGGSFTYRYDDNDNIEKILEVGKGLNEYIYDGFGQLKEERSAPRNRSILYTYDKNGNILTKTEYSGSNGAVGTPTNTNTYTYGNSQWKDLLTKYNGQTITYDAVGNPLTYRDSMSFTWTGGRRMKSSTSNGQTISYQYDHNGLRLEKKLSDGTKHQYDYDGNLLIREKYGDEALWFVYDESGSPIGIRQQSNDGVHVYAYFFIKNAQGDVIGLVQDGGNVVMCLLIVRIIRIKDHKNI